jgi:selenocysteine-specific elongation factor
VNWIIGTAGHIDHGKTSLIKALTGQDTDRLKEEKERGISIDLGFAYFDLADGVRAGIVDVPGHERFIRNMLAGAHGMDLVLFTVAADDGVMPQTREHLDILHLLGVTRAVFVLTKIDRASEARISDVTEQIRALIAHTSLDGSPVVRFSAITGEGLGDLRQSIADRLLQSTKPQPSGYFRLPVDRAFVVAGHGLIVTGTAVSGETACGDTVRCLPSNSLFRVRSIEVHGQSVQTASWGQRIALNLTGSSRAPIARGAVVCHEKISLVSDRFDAHVEVRPTATAAIKSHQRVRLHIGTSEVLAKLVRLSSDAGSGSATIERGRSAFCQIATTEPVVAMKGDRFILRDETAQRTIGGGVVVRPAAPRHKRHDAVVPQQLEALARGDESALIGAGGEMTSSLSELAQLSNQREEVLRVKLASSPALHTFNADTDTLYALERDCVRLKSSLVELLRGWHAAHPLSSGLDLEEARASLGARVAPKVFRIIVDEMAREGAVVREGSAVRLSGHQVAVPEQDRAVVERIKELLGRTPLAPPDTKTLMDDLKVDRRKLAELLRVLEKQRVVVSVGSDLYFLADSVDRVRGDLVRLLTEKGGITTAEFRDLYGTSRKYVIPLLEYFDRLGVTIRVGDIRQLKQRRLTETA